MGLNFHLPDPGRIINDIRHAAEDGINQARGQIENVAHQAEGEITSAAHELEGALKNVAHDAEDTINKAKQDALTQIQNIKQIGRKAIDDVEGAIVAAAFKKAIQRAIAVARIGVHKVSFSVQAVVGLELTLDASTILSKVQGYLDNPPSSSDEIKAFLIAVAPSEVRLFVGGGISIGIELDVELSVTFEKDELIENWDSILTALS